MTNKELVLIDISARLHYGLYIKIEGYGIHKLTGIDGTNISTDRGINYPLYLVKPYLRSLSSMTEEEKHELLKFGIVNLDKDNNVLDVCCVGFENHAKVQDYLNSIHVDYRGLIPKGLAIEAPEGMYNKNN